MAEWNRAAQVGLLVTCGLASIPAPALALPLIESVAGATSTLYDAAGNIAEEDLDSQTSASAGETVSVSATLFPPMTFCFPETDPHQCRTAEAEARTDYGSNGVRTWAARYQESSQGIQEIEDDASAISTWIDEWTFNSAGIGPLQPVTVDLAVDGSWNDWGQVAYLISVVDVLTATEVASASVSSCGPFTCADLDEGLLQVALADEGEQQGSFDATFQLSFRPTANGTYRVMATLASISDPAIFFVDGAEVNALNTASVTAVHIASDISFTSAAGAAANFNVVPEPSPTALLTLSVVVLACGRRRAQSPPSQAVPQRDVRTV